MFELMIGSALRLLAATAAGWLAANGVSCDDVSRFATCEVGNEANAISGVLLAAVTLLWAAWRNRNQTVKLEEAIQSPAGFATRDAAAKAGVDVEGNGTQKTAAGHASPVMNAKNGRRD